MVNLEITGSCLSLARAIKIVLIQFTGLLKPDPDYTVFIKMDSSQAHRVLYTQRRIVCTFTPGFCFSSAADEWLPLVTPVFSMRTGAREHQNYLKSKWVMLCPYGLAKEPVKTVSLQEEASPEGWAC